MNQSAERERMSRRHFLAVNASAGLGLGVAGSGLAIPLSDSGAEESHASLTVEIADEDGALSRTRAPVRASLKLPEGLRRAAAQGGLVAREITGSGDEEPGKISVVPVPVQLLPLPSFGALDDFAQGSRSKVDSGSAESKRSEPVALCWMLPERPAAAKKTADGNRRFALEFEATPPEARPKPAVTVIAQKVDDGQFEISDGNSRVLRYNYLKVDAGQVLKQVSAENMKYAVARSDYIHPLFGPVGETLTKDWSVDHPHHRGIYWAWPEVDWRGKRGDLHALQQVFARPTGRCRATSGPVFGELLAENLWHWESGEPIVREQALIRAYHAGGGSGGSQGGRLLDLELRFEAMNEPVALARRGTSHYGGLNIRLAAIQDQRLTKFTDPESAHPRRAWSDVSGVFDSSAGPAGLTVLQHASNPDYPGDWVDYPELNWLQPTFPRSGSRYTIEKGKPLVLRFRLWVHRGNLAAGADAADAWSAANAAHSPLS